MPIPMPIPIYVAIIIGSFFKNTITIQFCTPKSFREINFKAYTTEN